MGIRSIDDRRDSSRFEKIPEDGHRVLFARHREVRFGQLFHKEGEKQQFDEVGNEPERALA